MRPRPEPDPETPPNHEPNPIQKAPALTRQAMTDTNTQRNETSTAKTDAKAKQQLIDYTGQVEAIRRSQAVIEFELDGTITFANENFLQTVGYRLDEIVGKHHRMFADPEYAASAEYQQFWDRLARGEFFSGEFRRLGKGGKEIWIQASYNPILDESNKPFKVVKYASDITEQKLASADSAGQINAIGKSQAVIEFTPDGTILNANDNFLGAVGYTLAEIQGQHHRIFCDPAYTKTPEYSQFWAKLAGGEYEAGEFKRFGKDGSEIWIQASYNPIMDMSGKVFKVVKYASDITAQKQAEAESRILSDMLKGAGAMFMACDKDLVITYCNPAVMDMLRQYEPAIKKLLPKFDSNKLIGTCIDDFHKNPAHQRKILADDSMLPISSELKLGPLTFGVRAAAIYDADGNYNGASVEWTDFNDREKYREQVSKVIAASEAGDLSVRGDLEVLNDVYRPMMEGINEIVEAVVKPITEASDVLERMAEADLTARMTGEYQGDFNNIKENLNRAGDALEQALLGVADSAGQVGSASSQISEGAQKLAEGASTQASSIEEISASLQEMQAMTGQNADNAGQANTLSGEALSSADKGNSAMERMEGAIDKIKSSSDQTAKIVKTIDEIAFQTNLLALNAAVEAARAGDAGKGFAVVAEEVRSLAKRSAEAAKTTAELIDDAVKNAEGGVTITQDVREILTDIVDGSRKVNDLIAEIASASKEQAEGIKQITEGVTAMDKVTQENSANSEESAAAASQLNEQAQSLNQMIGKFTLGQGEQQAAFTSNGTTKKPVTTPRKTSAKPQNVIPLDDDDLAQF
ncbi:MAG: methyl-accepting chemotaxis protein [Planctomycetota bacterium]